jgi:hypothetical protein
MDKYIIPIGVKNGIPKHRPRVVELLPDMLHISSGIHTFHIPPVVVGLLRDLKLIPTLAESARYRPGFLHLMKPATRYVLELPAMRAV